MMLGRRHLPFCLIASAFAFIANAEMTPQSDAVCIGRVALQPVLEVKVDLAQLSPRSRPHQLGYIEHMESTIRKTREGQYELQIYDPSLQARYYAAGKIDMDGKPIELAIWSHQQNVDLSCRISVE